MVERREVSVDGRPVPYRVAGKGKPLVLVHGLAGSWRWWTPVIEPLAARRRIYVVDLRRLRHVGVADLSGWLARWLDAVGLERVDLAGHSLGGLIAAELAASRPERTRRLVLVAPAGIPCGRSLPGRAVPLLGTLYDIRWSLPMITADALRTGPLSMARAIAFVSTRDLRTELATVRAPTLLVWGDGDLLVPSELAEEWERVLPDSRLERLACGHVPMLEAPGELAERIGSFLETELADDSGDQVGPGVVNRVRLAGDRNEPSAR
jgi:pimeloyl-ACP methyl ester carboxylesterase